MRVVTLFVLMAAGFTYTPVFGQSCTGECVQSPPSNCAINQGVYTIFGCRASVTAGWRGTGNPEEVSSCVANPPRGYYLFDTIFHEVDRNNGSYSSSKYQGGLDFKYEQSIDEAYKSALELAGKIVDQKKRKEVEGKINEAWENHRKLAEQVKTNIDTVRLEVKARGHGSPVDRKRGWETAEVFMKIMCVLPSNLDEQVKSRFGLDDVKSSLPVDVVFKNDSGEDVFLASQPADIFTKCSDATTSTSLTKIRAHAELPLLIDPELQLCYKFMPEAKTEVKTADTCRASTGDVVKKSASKDECRL